MPITVNTCAQKDALNTALDCYGDTWRAYRSAYELAYYDEFGRLPDDAIVIERIEEYPEGRLIIHADRDGVKQ